MTQTSILNEFAKIEKNIELCKNPNNGGFAFSMLFKVDEFMIFYNDFKQAYEKCNFRLVSIITHYDIGMLNVSIAIKDIASVNDMVKMRAFLDFMLKQDIIDFYN